MAAGVGGHPLRNRLRDDADLRRRATAFQSPMLEIDARSWAVSTSLSLALLIGFAIAAALDGTPLQGGYPIGCNRAARHGVLMCRCR